MKIIALALVALDLSGCTPLNTLARRVESAHVGIGFTWVQPDGTEFTNTETLDATFAKEKASTP